MADTTAVGHHYHPEVVLPPGETLAELLEGRGMTQAELAERTGLLEEHVDRIIVGRAPLTPEIAAVLERETRVSARVWANLETAFRAHESRMGGKDRKDRGLVAGAADGR